MWTLFKIKFFLLLTFVGFSAAAFSQSRYNKAEKLYQNYQYEQAARLYKKAAFGKRKEDALFKLGECYRKMKKFDKAEKVFSKLVAGNPKDPKAYYYYAEALMHNKKYAEARKNLALYLEKNPGDKKGKTQIRACDELQTWTVGPVVYKVYPLEKVNTPFSDFSPVVFNNNLIFASESKKDQFSGNKNYWNGNPNLCVFMARGSKKGDSLVFKKPKIFSSRFDDDAQNGPVSFSSDQSEIYFTRTDYVRKKSSGFVNRPRIYIGKMKGNKPANIQPFEHNTDGFSFAHPSLSKNGQRLFFVSDMPGGLGGTDIWYCEKTGGSWGKPVNAGSAINTPGNESFPFVAEDGTLYFSSDGRMGFGGLDIYASRFLDGKFEIAANLQYPINSAADDFGIFWKDSKSGYFSSNRSGGKGSDDIYGFYKVNASSELAGRILETKTAKTGVPNSTVALLNEKNDVLQTTTTDDGGYFLFNHIPSGYNYYIKLEETSNGSDLKENYYLADASNRIVAKTVIGRKGVFMFEKLPSDLTKLNKIVEEDADFRSIAGNFLVGEEKIPLSNIKVELKNDQGEIVQSTTTNAFGSFVFANIPTDQNYLITLDAEDKDLDGKKIFFVNKNGKEIAVNDKGFKFQILSTDKTTLGLLSVKDADLRMDLKGKILGDNNSPLANSKLLVVNEKGDVIQTVTTNEKGEFVFVSLPTDKKYLFQIDEKDAGATKFKNLMIVDERGKILGKFHLLSGKFNWAMLPSDQKDLAKIYLDDPWLKVEKLKTVKKDTLTIIENIYYDYGKWDILAEAKITLDKVVQVMKENPGVTIELQSHTDSRSTDDFNLKLSQKRAQAAVDYIISKGIEKQRLTATGFGESRLKNHCKDGVECSEEEHAQNRRTEFRIHRKK